VVTVNWASIILDGVLMLFAQMMILTFLTLTKVYAVPINPVNSVLFSHPAQFPVDVQPTGSMLHGKPRGQSLNAFTPSSITAMQKGARPLLADNIIISSEPFEKGAKVFINGAERGQVPMKVTLPVGSHAIRVYGRQGEGEAIIAVHTDRVSRGVRDVVVALAAYRMEPPPSADTSSDSQTKNILKAIAVAVGVVAVVSVSVIVYVMYAMVERGGWSK